MPLSKRQKRRLQEISKMIESSITVRDDMVEIQTEYANEIDSVIEKIRRGDTVIDEHGSSTDLSLFSGEPIEDNKEQKQAHDTSEQEPPPISDAQPIVDDAPDWAKTLWKSIAKKCHPDRLSFQELTAIEISRRQIWFLEARKLFEEKSYGRLLHIGVQLEEFVEGISSKEQLSMLNGEYSVITEKINDVQSSLAWKWGTNWDNLELRIKIVTACLTLKDVKVPPKLKLIQLLVNLELD